MAKRIPNLKRSYKDSTSLNKSHPVVNNNNKPVTQKRTKSSNPIKVATSKSSHKVNIPKFGGGSSSTKSKTIRAPKPQMSAEQKELITTLKKSITAEKRRIKNLINRASERGYVFSDELVESLDFMDLTQLKSLTTDALYDMSTSTKFGTTMKGSVVRKLERSIAGRKAWETRMLNELIKASEKMGTEDEEEYIPSFTNIVLSEVEGMIREAKANPVIVGYGDGKNNKQTTGKNADMLLDHLITEIERYGRDKVAMACEQAPDEIISRARETIQASESSTCRQYCEDIMEVITGYIPTVEEQKDRNISDLMDDDSDLELL